MRNVILKLQRARALHQQGQVQQARTLYREILKLQPAHVEVLNALAIIAGQSKDFDQAVTYFDKVLKIEPNHVTAYNNRGLALQELQQFEPALKSYNRALELKPDYAVGHYNRGNVLRELGRTDEALVDYGRAIAANPNFAQAYYNRGVLLERTGSSSAALADYRQAVFLKPDYVEAYYNAGVLFQQTEDWSAALESYDHAIALKPQHAEAFVNRGVILKTLFQYGAALASYNIAIEINPKLPSAYFNRAQALADLNQLPQSVEDYDRAIALGSNAKGIYGSSRHARMQIGDWRDHALQTAALLERIEHNEPVSSPFHVLTMTDNAELQGKAAAAWMKDERTPAITLINTAGSSRREKIRIGYFSADFHDHATMYLMAGLFEQHDPATFEIVAFSFGPDRQDAMRTRLRSACRQFFEVREQSDAAVAALSRDLHVDIAIDLKGLTQFGRPGIFSARAAPLQVSYLGYPGTMGVGYMDYLIADRTLIPSGYEQFYREKIIYLPSSYQVNDSTRRISEKPISRRDMALPETGFVFCCFNNTFKITPGMFDIWMRILTRVENSVLWLYEPNPIAALNLKREAQFRGVAADRLIFATFQTLPVHLARHRVADLFLDTLPCNAHTTASDSLWAGLPVLTCTGEAFASRVAASLLLAADLPELVTTTLSQYEELAIQLAMHPTRLGLLKLRLAEQRLTTSLFNTQLFTQELEQAYSVIYERYHANLPCESVYVSARTLNPTRF